MRTTGRLGLVFVLWASLVGCGSPGGGSSATQGDELGSMRASFAASVFVGDVAAVRVDVLQNGDVVASQTVQAPPPGAAVQVMDAFFVLPVGTYQVLVTPLDTSGNRSKTCGSAAATAVVTLGKTTEVTLSLFCEAAGSGGLDVVVTTSQQPVITGFTFDPGKFIELCQPLVMTAQAQGTAPLTWAWTIDSQPTDASTAVLKPNQNTALFEATAAGTYGVTVQVTDPAGRSASLSVPVHVLDAGVCAGSQQLFGYITGPMAAAPWASLVPAQTPITVAVGLPMIDAQGLQAFVQQASDPSSPAYRQYLTPDEFSAAYGANPADYQALVAFAQGHNLSVQTYPNRLLADLTGSAADVGAALHVNLSYYERPDGTLFYGPDREPSLDLAVPVLRISGLDTFIAPTPRLVRLSREEVAKAGTGQGGAIFGPDFRTSYASCTALTGAGQSVGLFQMDGYRPADITAYETAAGLTAVPLRNVLTDGFSGTAGTGGVSNGDLEVTLDIEMAISIAPGLTEVVVFEGTNPASILHAMATQLPLSNQLSSSWGFGSDDNQRQALGEMAAQGQTYFDASGDSGAFTSDPGDNTDDPFETLVGGTILTMSGNGTAYQSETTWPGSSGGVLTNVPIPGYQQTVNMSTNGGSTTSRDAPDVALIASNVQITYKGAAAFVAGTSIAAPLWAGFTALVNQQAAANNVGPVGFANPAFYAIGQTPAVYGTSFHDITTGNNGTFNAVAGYDLATGWGTPACGLINQLGSITPTVPATFGLLELLISTGGDDLRGDSSATADLIAPGASLPFQTVTLKTKSEPAWNNGSVHDLIVPLVTPQGAGGIGSIVIHLIQGGSFPETDDNWNIESVNAWLVAPGSLEVCQIDVNGDPFVRLTGSAGDVTFNIPDGCPTGTNPPPPTTVDTVEFDITTGGDDLRGDSAATADLYAPGASTPFETVTLKNGNESAWNNGTVHQVIVPLGSPQPGIGKVTVNLIQGGSFPETDDNWNIEGISVTAYNPGGPEACVVDLNGDPVVRLTGSAGSITFDGRSGCP